MNKTASNKRIQRAQLDKRFKQLRQANLNSPGSGWIRTIRLALGMSATQLAKRIGVTPQTIKDYEDAEQSGTITIATLKKVADALGCESHMILIPNESLESVIQKQALKAANKIVNHADSQMKLEAQGTGEAFKKKQIRELAEEISNNMSRDLWEQ